MIEIETGKWAVPTFFNVVELCAEMFGPCHWGQTWYWKDDGTLYMTEECLTMFLLKWEHK
jgi:hypothetical protein